MDTFNIGIVDTDLAWAAGFFDGEGNVCFSDTDKKRAPRILAQIAQVNRSPLDRFAKIVGMGNVTGPYEPKTKNSRPYYKWSVDNLKRVSELYELVGPWLDADKTDAFKFALSKYNEWAEDPKCIHSHSLELVNTKYVCRECKRIGGINGMKSRWNNG